MSECCGSFCMTQRWTQGDTLNTNVMLDMQPQAGSGPRKEGGKEAVREIA